MAHSEADPLEALISDGRLYIRPTHHYGEPDIITVNLELLHAIIVQRITEIYLNDLKLRNQYPGSLVQTGQYLTNDITALADYAVGQTYNRLRTILERTSPNARTARMNPRCPVPANQEFPEWISSTLSSIGPCRITDGPRDRLIVYASTTATMVHYGRENPVAFTQGNYTRIIYALRSIGVRLAPFNHSGIEGSYFPTITPQISEGVWSLYGQVHHSHYENEDCARIAFLTSNVGITPFENIGMTIGYVNNEATLNALAAVAAPDNIPAHQTANSPGIPRGGMFRVNYYGIQPAAPAQGAIPAQARGVYIIGRGTEIYYHCTLAHSVSVTEILDIMRNRLLR